MRDIEALLAEAAGQMVSVRELYAASLRASEVAPGLQTKIKNVLENERSALEYLAHDVVERFGESGAKCYFPIVTTPEDFPARFDKTMRGVAAARPDIRDAVEERQPYNGGYEWLGHLATLTNENKHQRLSAQERVEATELRPGPGGTGIIGTPTGGAIRLEGSVSLVTSDGGSMSFGDGPVTFQNVQRTVLVDWIFADLGVTALGTLETVFKQLPALVADIAGIAGL